MARNDLSKAIGRSRWSRSAASRSYSSFEASDAPLFWAQTPDRRAPIGGALKRMFDLAFALLLIAFAAPLMALIAVAIYLCDRGSPFYGHERIGFQGRPFRCWKFRTMTTNSEAALQAYFAANPDKERLWAENFKLDPDPRVTWIGRALRRSSLDELPQLFNVVLGQMSCVGPRPVVAQELTKYGASAHDYLRARPGMTGMWQVNGRSRANYTERVAFDVEYVRTWSPTLDVKIMLKTIPAVLDFDATS